MFPKKALIFDFFNVGKQLFPQFFHIFLVPFMKNQYPFVLIEISERLEVIVLLYQLFMYTQCGWCDSLLLYVVHDYFNAFVSITKLLLS